MNAQQLIQLEANNYASEKAINGVDAKIVRRDFINGATFGLSLAEIEVNAVKEHNELLVAELKRVLSKNGWVSVKDRLPTLEDAKNENVYFDGMVEAWHEQIGSAYLRYEEVEGKKSYTHWRRIIKPVTPTK